MDVFLLWSICGVLFMFFGIYALCAKKPVRFWNIQETIQVNDVKKYNRAMAKLWFAAAVSFIIIGIPLVIGYQAAWITMLGSMWWAIALMVVYTRIEKKYRVG